MYNLYPSEWGGEEAAEPRHEVDIAAESPARMLGRLSTDVQMTEEA